MFNDSLEELIIPKARKNLECIYQMLMINLQLQNRDENDAIELKTKKNLFFDPFYKLFK